jgi:hypothetical protein
MYIFSVVVVVVVFFSFSFGIFYSSLSFSLTHQFSSFHGDVKGVALQFPSQVRTVRRTKISFDYTIRSRTFLEFRSIKPLLVTVLPAFFVLLCVVV